MMEIDRGSVRSGDSIRWKTRRGTTAHGLVQYKTADAVHVELDKPGDSAKYRYTIPWGRVTGRWPGREQYDRVRGALTDHAAPKPEPESPLRQRLSSRLALYGRNSRGESAEELASNLGCTAAQVRRELAAMQQAGLVDKHRVRGVVRYVPGWNS